jgi:hypothetical protein
MTTSNNGCALCSNKYCNWGDLCSPSNNDSWIEDLLDAAINFKQASVDFAAEAELFGDNKAVLDTANARLDHLKAAAAAEIRRRIVEQRNEMNAEFAVYLKKRLNEARIDELEKLLKTGIISSFSNDAFITVPYLNDRIKELKQSGEDTEPTGTGEYRWR